MTHELKCYPEPFQALYLGSKTFEVQQEDGRKFDVQDSLYLREYDPKSDQYTGRWVSKLVTYIARGPLWGLPTNLVVMSLA